MSLIINHSSFINFFIQKKFLLVHDDVNLFHRSEWDSGDGSVPSTAYTVYRLVLQKVASELHPRVRNHGEGPY